MFFELHPRDTEDVARTRGCPREEGSKERWNLGGSREDFLCCGDVNPKVLAPPFLFLQALEDLLGRCEGAENDICSNLESASLIMSSCQWSARKDTLIPEKDKIQFWSPNVMLFILASLLNFSGRNGISFRKSYRFYGKI